MNRTRIWITWAAFLATFAWMLLPDFKISSAVLWPSALAVGLALVTGVLAVFAFPRMVASA